MPYIPVENVIDKTGQSIYKLVILASKRAVELAEGVPALTNADHHVKTTTVALQEIAENKIRIKK